MSKKKTHVEYVAELVKVNPNIEVVGIYCGANIKIPHRCKKDGYVWDLSPSNALFGKGCPKCGGTIKKTHEEYVAELSIKNPTVEVVEKYITAKTKIMHHCLIHDVYWKTEPRLVLSGHGCSECKNERISASIAALCAALQKVSGAEHRVQYPFRDIEHLLVYDAHPHLANPVQDIGCQAGHEPYRLGQCALGW